VKKLRNSVNKCYLLVLVLVVVEYVSLAFCYFAYACLSGPLSSNQTGHFPTSFYLKGCEAGEIKKTWPDLH